jgi:hypothetical protein
MDFENDPIIWGVGLTSMVGKRWADVVGCWSYLVLCCVLKN